jgi:hypothetical protein
MDTLPLEASPGVMRAQYEGEQATAGFLYRVYLNLTSPAISHRTIRGPRHVRNVNYGSAWVITSDTL